MRISAHEMLTTVTIVGYRCWLTGNGLLYWFCKQGNKDMKTTYKTNYAGHNYEVDITPELRNESFYKYCQVYRMRKDGSRGRKLMSHQHVAWAVWNRVKDEVEKQ